jgi:ParB family chromosome partitioning protein
MTTHINSELTSKIGSLSNLIKARAPNAETAGHILLVPVDAVKPGPHQPRKTFHKLSLEELASTIEQDGITVPLIVRRTGPSSFELIAGERRWRAAQIAGLREVPVIVRDLDDASARRQALIDNIQREDLCLADEVLAIAQYIKDLGSARAVAAALGKSEQWVSKRNILATNAHPLVHDLLTTGRSADADGLLELNRLAAKDETAAAAAVASFQNGTSLRNHLKRANGKSTTPNEKGRALAAPDVVRKARNTTGAVLVTKVAVIGGALRLSTSLGPIDLTFGTAALAALGKAVQRVSPTSRGTSAKGRGAVTKGARERRT